MHLSALVLLLATATPANLDTARADLRAGRLDRAARAFEQAGKADATCAECWLGLAEARLGQGALEAGLKAAERGLAVASEGAQQARGHNLVGVAQTRLARGDRKRMGLAADAFQKAAATDPADLNLLFNLGRSLLMAGRVEEGQAALASLLKQAPQDALASHASRLIAHPERADLPLAPDLTLTTIDGERVALSSLRGRMVVLDFWATWCGPCVASVPELKDLRRRYRPEQLAIVSVSADHDAGRWRAFVEKHGLAWTQVHDPEGGVTQQFGVQAFPTYLVIDADGFVTRRLSGLDPRRSLVARLGKELESLLGDGKR